MSPAAQLSGSRLDGKVALVTGGARGIGKGIALELADRGASVVVNYNSSPAPAKEVVKQIEALGSKAVALQADVSSFDSIVKLYRDALSHFGKLDIVVSNSGLEHFEAIEDVTPEQFDRIFNVNTRGQYFVAQQGYKNISTGGRIIMMSSIAANLRGIKDHAIYSASKAAIEAMVRSFPSDFSPKRVTVNAVAPGGIETDMASENGWRYIPNGSPNMKLESVAEALADNCPLKRFGAPRDVARVIGFLASEDGGWVNGQTITISGGSGK
ncbi:MAG: putative secondary metabolism biosynthetic enzyme [Sclerophora amabilis]|nr:MAG: putative secondary metabolism biosynthetic enzyme [Sclerophora amabilis]